MKTIIINTTLRGDEINTEDGGQAKIFTASPDDNENGLFINICSWDENKEHTDFNKLIGKKIRITIETID